MPTMTRRNESLNVYAEYHCSSYGYSYSIYVYIYKQLHLLSFIYGLSCFFFKTRRRTIDCKIESQDQNQSLFAKQYTNIQYTITTTQYKTHTHTHTHTLIITTLFSNTNTIFSSSVSLSCCVMLLWIITIAIVVFLLSPVFQAWRLL